MLRLEVLLLLLLLLLSHFILLVLLICLERLHLTPHSLLPSPFILRFHFPFGCLHADEHG